MLKLAIVFCKFYVNEKVQWRIYLVQDNILVGCILSGVGPLLNKFEQVCSDHHQMSLATGAGRSSGLVSRGSGMGRALADPRGARGTHAPWASKFFQFHAVFWNIWQNSMLASTRVGALKPRENPGCATEEGRCGYPTI